MCRSIGVVVLSKYFLQLDLQLYCDFGGTNILSVRAYLDHIQECNASHSKSCQARRHVNHSVAYN